MRNGKIDLTTNIIVCESVKNGDVYEPSIVTLADGLTLFEPQETKLAADALAMMHGINYLIENDLDGTLQVTREFYPYYYGMGIGTYQTDVVNGKLISTMKYPHSRDLDLLVQYFFLEFGRHHIRTFEVWDGGPTFIVRRWKVTMIPTPLMLGIWSRQWNHVQTPDEKRRLKYLQRMEKTNENG